eukprot:gene3769-4693_t
METVVSPPGSQPVNSPVAASATTPTNTDSTTTPSIIEIPPNQTIYINNLNEKVSKKKLTEQLYSLFSKYGTVLEIVASKSDKMRGQAFVVFKDITSASNSLREMNGFNFLEKPMRIQYSKNKSDAVAKLDGTYMERKREREQDKEEKRKAKRQDTSNNKKGGAASGAKRTPGSSSSSSQAQLKIRQAPPNKNLFVENLPDNCDSMALQILFRQCPGFKEVHMVESKKGIAFIEFEDEHKSAVAMNNLQYFNVSPDKPMIISFAAQ